MPLVLHPTTAALVERFRAHLPSSLLIEGEQGVGLQTLARDLAGTTLMGVIEPTDKDGKIDHSKGSIKIESIRGLYEQTRAKQTAQQVVIIDDADTMSHGAQNAFLKLLEEPGEHIHFILTSHRPRLLLPTIHSRVQHLSILPLTAEQTTAFIQQSKSIDAKKAAQLQFIATGLPAEITRLLADDVYFSDKASAMADARTFLQGMSFERFGVAFRYTTREKALQLLDSALTILRRSISRQPESKLVTQLDKFLAAREAIDANHHVRLQLSQLVVQ